MVGHGGSSAGSYLADPTSPIPSHCASIVVTSTLRVKKGCTYYLANTIWLLLIGNWYYFSTMPLPKIQITDNDSDDDSMVYTNTDRRCSMPVLPSYPQDPSFLSPDSCRPKYQRQRSKSHGNIQPLSHGSPRPSSAENASIFYDTLHDLEGIPFHEQEEETLHDMDGAPFHEQEEDMNQARRSDSPGSNLPHGSSLFEQIMQDMHNVSVDDKKEGSRTSPQKKTEKKDKHTLSPDHKKSDSESNSQRQQMSHGNKKLHSGQSPEKNTTNKGAVGLKKYTHKSKWQLP